MKKRVISLVLALLLCAALIPAPEAHAASGTINVYNWGQYISDGSDGYIDSDSGEYMESNDAGWDYDDYYYDDYDPWSDPDDGWGDYVDDDEGWGDYFG